MDGAGLNPAARLLRLLHERRKTAQEKTRIYCSFSCARFYFIPMKPGALGIKQEGFWYPGHRGATPRPPAPWARVAPLRAGDFAGSPRSPTRRVQQTGPAPWPAQSPALSRALAPLKDLLGRRPAGSESPPLVSACFRAGWGSFPGSPWNTERSLRPLGVLGSGHTTTTV